MTEDISEEKLKKAINQKIHIDAIEEFIGQKPVISTIEKNGWDAIRMAEIAADEKHIERLPDLSQTGNIAYWKVKEERTLVRIAGLWWDKKDEAHIFYGIIYPP